MTRKTLVLLAGLMASSAAFAAEDIMAGMYGNTLLVIDNTGTSKYRYAPDHTVTGALANGKALKGTWLIDAGKLCETFEGEKQICYPFTAHKPGDAWNGQPGVKLEVKAGLQ